MSIRRAADPSTVQHVWDAFKTTNSQRPVMDVKRLIKHVQRIESCTYSQAELYIQQVVQDGLIIALQKFSGKGEEIESFKMPDQNFPELDGRDWYCFECHVGGNVVDCGVCFRVFHSDCVMNGRHKFELFKKANNTTVSNIIQQNMNKSSSSNREESSVRKSFNNNELNDSSHSDDGTIVYDDKLCCICNMANVNNDFDLHKTEINYLLKFVLHRIQSWLPSIITHTMAEDEKAESVNDTDLTWRANHLFFEHRDMSVIEVNLNSNFYLHVYEFLADVLTIKHNVAIFHGAESQEYGAAELMVRDCLHDLGELKNCVDCYRHSNEKKNTKWFCLPCRKPHQLVWAKQKGYPYWPAKVIRETATHADVRFFGGKYERSLLSKSFVKPITIKKETLQIKNTVAFNKALDELAFHQTLLNSPDELKKFLESNMNTTKSRRNSSKGSGRNSFMKTTTSVVVAASNNNQSGVDDVSIRSTNGSPSKSDVSIGSDSRDISLDNNKVETTPNKNSSKKRKLHHNSEDVNNLFKTNCFVLLSKENIVEDVANKSIPLVDEIVDKDATENVIAISDGEEEDDRADDYSFKNDPATTSIDCEQVSSSTENYHRNQDAIVGIVNHTIQDNGMQQLDHPYCDSVERMRRKMEYLTDKTDIVKCAMDCMQSEIDKISNDHSDHLKRLFESHNTQISDTKKKQWCYNCEQDAIYHCCWNTAYCSQSCQQQHWQAEHKKVCRRKR